MSSEQNDYSHWCDELAKTVAARRSAGPVVCAAGISPSGTVHIGNFREIMTVDLVFRALRDRGAAARALYFWDDYDALRAIPQNFAHIANVHWEDALRKPLADIVDPHGAEESYARYNERAIERVLPLLGIAPEYIYQSRHYRQHQYVDMVRRALQKRDTIRAILNKHRTTLLASTWWPITVYSSFSGKDTTTITDWDGESRLTYLCHETEQSESIDIRTAENIKLRWRVDWPMRWAHYGVDFEPAGKDHHSEGGSFDTAVEIAAQVFGAVPPISTQYDFIRIKGGSGKMSSSSGELLSVEQVLAVYQPEVLRYLFASTRPNAEFAVSFDADVIKIYEDYDRCERIAYHLEDADRQRIARERRIYQLSQCTVDGATLAGTAPVQLPFRHLCNLVQIYEGDVDRALEAFAVSGEISAAQRACAVVRARCAWHWVTHYAPAEFRFTLADYQSPLADLTEQQQQAFQQVAVLIRERLETFSAEQLHDALYAIATENTLSFRELCRLLYTIVIDRQHGPRLASFMILIGKERLLRYFDLQRIQP